MEGQALAAGARMEVRDGWNVAVAYDAGERERLERASAGPTSRTWPSSRSRGPHDLEPRDCATRADGAWWCRVTRDRALVIGDPACASTSRTPSTSRARSAALTIAGPLAREVFARFCALDLRPQAMPVRGFRPGSVARTPGYVLREDADRFLVLFGWALGEYLWTVVADAAESLGGGPVGVDALDREAARA